MYAECFTPNCLPPLTYHWTISYLDQYNFWRRIQTDQNYIEGMALVFDEVRIFVWQLVFSNILDLYVELLCTFQLFETAVLHVNLIVLLISHYFAFQSSFCVTLKLLDKLYLCIVYFNQRSLEIPMSPFYYYLSAMQPNFM